MSISVKTRFEVFKRDRYTCSYCGRTPPEVLLEADHIVPRAAGGTDEFTNLTTACQDCNRGKGAGLLEEGTAPVVRKATIEDLAERVEQAKAYMELLGGMQSLVERQIGMVTTAWATSFGAEVIEEPERSYYQFKTNERGELWPNDHSVRRFLKGLTLEEVLDAVNITAARFNGYPSDSTTRYFYGVCHRSIREGRSPGAPRDPEPARPVEPIGATLTTERLRYLFLHHAEMGYATLEDLVAALWPDDG